MSGFLNFASFNCLHGDQNPFHGAVRQADFDSLEIGLEPAASARCDVGADAAAFFGLTLAVDDAALGGTLAGDLADARHRKVDERSRASGG